MGYYSKFEVDGTDIPHIADVLNSVTDYHWDEYNGEVTCSDAKWYGWLTDLEEVARLYPKNYLIILRYGEDGGDIERAVVLRGRVFTQRPELKWPVVNLRD